MVGPGIYSTYMLPAENPKRKLLGLRIKLAGVFFGIGYFGSIS